VPTQSGARAFALDRGAGLARAARRLDADGSVDMSYDKNGNMLTSYVLSPAASLMNTVADQFTNRRLVLSGKKKKKKTHNTVYGKYAK